MNFREMVFALIAVVFFTTMILLFSKGMWGQAAILDKTNKIVQAIQLAHSSLDEIDAKLFSKQVAFSAVKTTFTGVKNVTLAHPGLTYKGTYLPADCDSLGNTVTPANNIWIKVTVKIELPSGGMGIPINLTRLYTKTNLYTP